jgi:hypothetical protein
MRKRSSIEPGGQSSEDLTQALNEMDSDESPPSDIDHVKNPAAVALGRLGGLKGGKARAEKLTPDQRSAIARRAAVARWSVRRTS